mgnify:CR=1 FL=1
MKIPKKIRMFGFDWKVIIDKKDGGGAYYWETKKIIIGNKYGEMEKVLLHEILEAIITYNHCRFYGNENAQEYQFLFNHTKFCEINSQFYDILKDNKLLK